MNPICLFRNAASSFSPSLLKSILSTSTSPALGLSSVPQNLQQSSFFRHRLVPQWKLFHPFFTVSSTPLRTSKSSKLLCIFFSLNHFFQCFPKFCAKLFVSGNKLLFFCSEKNVPLCCYQVYLIHFSAKNVIRPGVRNY